MPEFNDRPDFDHDHAQRIAVAAWTYIALTVRPHDGPGYQYRGEIIDAFAKLAHAVGLPLEPNSSVTAITHISPAETADLLTVKSSE